MKVKLIILILLYCCISCDPRPVDKSPSMRKEHQGEPNILIEESSPYLLQHAYNPVNWRPWNDKSLAEAKKTNKPLLISIGYSACHWCHVMERESFEDSTVAEIMNENFICIKVDREERPDIDHIYMDAVQLMSGRGGWPLNCFALPDGRPFYGGTYFPREQWKDILLQLSNLYQSDKKKVEEYADKLTTGLIQNELIEKVDVPRAFSNTILKKAVDQWRMNFDSKHGGNNYAPKFPMPNNYEFLLHYLDQNEDIELKNHLLLTLDKMAQGGIYDQIGGGFARYSTDMEWKVPHFEKMLYDNAQLISLYSNAFKVFKEESYKEVVEESISFLKREMCNGKGVYYSALDADSEGEEGLFYTWAKTELKEILTTEEYALAEDYFNINKQGEWEGRYIPLRRGRKEEFAEKNQQGLSSLSEQIASIKEKMFQARSNRVRPGLDDKSLTSWNALLMKGYLDAYEAFGESEYLSEAISIANFILVKQMNEEGKLMHSYKDGVSSINGFLEDYSFTLEAFVQLYENTFDNTWLTLAEKLADRCLEYFYDPTSSYFFFNSSEDTELINRKIEKADNVIPASNSSLCKTLFKLGSLLSNQEYLDISDQMLANSMNMMEEHIAYSSNWAQQLLIRSKEFHEIAIVGKEALSLGKEIRSNYLPNSIIVGSIDEATEIELLKNKWVNGKSLIYVCVEKTCKRPVEVAESAIEQIN